MRPSSCRFEAILLAATLLAGIATATRADDLPKPVEPVILTIEGAITRTNAPGRAEFDYAMLAELGLVTRVIDTPWTDAGTRFEGVPARVLMRHVGAKGRWAEALAINDYRVDVPLSDLTEQATLFALSKNGARMQLRGKGPIWLLYEDSARREIADAELRVRMVWQLKSLNIVE